MTVYETKERCPEIVLEVGNNRRYTDVDKSRVQEKTRPCSVNELP